VDIDKPLTAIFGLHLIRPKADFYVLKKHSKVSFELLEINSAAQKYLPLQGAGNLSEVGLPVSTCGGMKMIGFIIILLKIGIKTQQWKEKYPLCRKW
jgi:hypothetical protein